MLCDDTEASLYNLPKISAYYTSFMVMMLRTGLELDQIFAINTITIVVVIA